MNRHIFGDDEEFTILKVGDANSNQSSIEETKNANAPKESNELDDNSYPLQAFKSTPNFI